MSRALIGRDGGERHHYSAKVGRAEGLCFSQLVETRGLNRLYTVLSW